MFDQLIRRTEFLGNRHQAAEFNGIVHIGGIVADDASLDMASQTQQVLEKLDRILLACGSSRAHVLLILASISDMTLKPQMNAVWTRWFEPEHAPARATFGVSAIEDDFLIEIVAIAAKRDPDAH